MSDVSTVYPKNRLSLREVGLRDGLQLVKHYPSTRAKKAWIQQEAAAGVRHFEVGSFLPANRMPQFADVRALIDLCDELGVHSAALALNERGAQDAMDTPVDEIVAVVSATEAHSQANMRRSRDRALELVRTICEMRRSARNRPIVQAGIAMAFGCSIAGEVDADEIVRLAQACAEAGADVIGLADTVGFAGPDQIHETTRRVVEAVGSIPVSLHLHDTRGMGIANASAALDSGARVLDGSLGGLGGCPFAPGATGNVVFEDLIYLCERKGYETGIDLEALIEVRAIVSDEMPDEPLYGTLARAGVPADVCWRSNLSKA